VSASFDTIVLGAGPAGTGPLLCAMQRGDHQRLLEKGVLWIDRGEGMVAGSLGQHDILSDTVSDVLLECLKQQERGPLASMLSDPVTDEVKKYAAGPLPLPVAGRYLAALGRVVRGVVDGSARSRFCGGTTVTGIEADSRGFVVHTMSAAGARAFSADRVVLALGGYQSEAELLDATIAGSLRLRDGFGHKTTISSRLVSTEGQAALSARLRGAERPRVVIVGGSHSAVTAAWLALNRTGVALSEGAVRILCRRLPKLFYASRDAARQDGYRAWGERDVCPVTGRVFRLSGLRLAARELMRSVWGLGDAAPETRVVAIPFEAARDESAVREELERADVVVSALGYAPRTVPIVRDGAPLTLLADTRYRAPLVDGQCRVLLASGEALPNAFGIGLASGFVPHGGMGGEPSFDGQTNGLWLYQNGIGELILAQMLGQAA
jgi:hypothetical protein